MSAKHTRFTPPLNSSNRIRTRKEFAAVVTDLINRGSTHRTREIIVEREYDTDKPYEQFGDLLDVLMREPDFARRQALLYAACMTFYEMGRGHLRNADTTFEEYEDAGNKLAN